MSASVGQLIADLRALSDPADDTERHTRIAQLEQLKSVVAAVQARETAAYVASRTATQTAKGVPAKQVGRGIPEEVALARRISPWQAHRYCGWASILTSELPQTFAALERGEISEWRAMIVARETLFLTREHRTVVDAEIAPRLANLGDRKVEALAKQIGYRLDPYGYVQRSAAAVTERRVSVRPAPDSMCRLTAFVPLKQGVACYASLKRAADTGIGVGDPDGRSHAQLMADLLVERITGQTTADAVPVEVELVMSDETLLGGNEPAFLDGIPIPAPAARGMLTTDAPVWLRRLFRSPATGQLAAMETRARYFTDNQRRFFRLRDQNICRTPFCGAPIRHADHINPVENGGKTSVVNGNGLCAACNYAKQAAGWSSSVDPDTGEVVITTPTGHQYRHRPPDPPQARARPRPRHGGDAVWNIRVA